MEAGQIHIRSDRRHVSFRERIVSYTFFKDSLGVSQGHVALVFGVEEGENLLPSKVRVVLLHG